MSKITYAVTVCDELEELVRLVNFLQRKMDEGDEILIQYDSDRATDAVIDYLKVISGLHQNITIISYPLNGNFAEFKNNLKRYANGEFIVQLDADELLDEYLIENLHRFLDMNKDVDLYFVPRVNTVEGLTDEHIQKWGWKVNEQGHVNFPDYQTRIYRRTSEIEWEGKVHERIKGYNTFSVLPAEKEYALYHPKGIERQERQNELYEKL
jgi:glycosyltransferase involved in cell wall biosynthesis